MATRMLSPLLSGNKDLDEFMEAVGLKNKELQDRSQQVQKIMAENEKNAQELIAAQVKAGENSQIILAAKELTHMEVERKTADMATKLGINPDGSSEVLDVVADEWKQSKIASVQAQQELAKDLSVKFLDDPIGYIGAQIGMEKTIMQAEAAAKRQQAATASFSDIQQVTQQIPGQVSALQKTKSDATVRATLEGAAAMLEQNLAKTKLETAGINMQGLGMLNQMSTAELNNISSAISLKKQQEQLEQSRAAFSLQKKQFEILLEERTERMEQKKADRQELEDMAATVRKGAVVMGFDAASAFPTAKIVSMVQAKNPQMMDFWRAGMSTEATGHPVISDDAGQTARMLVTHNAPLRPEQKSVANFLRETWNEAASPEAGMKGRYDNTKIDQVQAGARNLAVAKAQEQMAHIKHGDNTNIYAPPPLVAVMDLKPIKTSRWYQTVMAPQMETGVLQEFNPEQLVSLTAAAVKSGKLDINSATEGLQAAFGGARSLNNATKNYIGMRLPPQQGYKVKLPNSLGFNRNYDLTTPQDVSLLLNSKLSGLSVTAGRNQNPFSFN